MRPARQISDEEENLRIVPIPGTRFETLRRDSVEPEPGGTIVLKAFRIASYSADCDGSLLATLENIDANGEETGWAPTALGIDPTDTIVLTIDEWRHLFVRSPATKAAGG